MLTSGSLSRYTRLRMMVQPLPPGGACYQALDLQPPPALTNVPRALARPFPPSFSSATALQDAVSTGLCYSSAIWLFVNSILNNSLSKLCRMRDPSKPRGVATYRCQLLSIILLGVCNIFTTNSSSPSQLIPPLSII